VWRCLALVSYLRDVVTRRRGRTQAPDESWKVRACARHALALTAHRTGLVRSGSNAGGASSRECACAECVRCVRLADDRV
jgi:hypothetical protein